MFGLKCITPAAGFVLFCLSPEGIGMFAALPQKKTLPILSGQADKRIQPDGGKQLCGADVHSGEIQRFTDVVPG